MQSEAILILITNEVLLTAKLEHLLKETPGQFSYILNSLWRIHRGGREGGCEEEEDDGGMKWKKGRDERG